MSTITRAQIAKQLIPGLRKIVGMAYTRYPDFHMDLFDTKNSEKYYEEDVMMGGLGLAVAKPEGSSVTYDTMQESGSARYVHEVLALGFQITEEAIDDNLYQDLSKKYAQALGLSLSQVKQIKAANVFNNGFNSSFAGGYDNLSLFNDAHLTQNGTYDNNVATDMAESALKTAFIDISKFTDDRGLKINAQPVSLHIPVDIKFDVFDILKSDLSTTTATNSTTGVTNTNNINSVRAAGIFPQGAKINNYFTDTDAWFVKTDVPDATIMFERKALKFGNDGDFDTGNLRFKGSERYSFGWTDPRGWYGSAGA